MHKSNTRKIALYGMLIALAFILSYIETLIPIPIPIPGIKLGLANIVVLIGLYALGANAAFSLSVVRVLLVSLTFGNMSMFWFSMAGAFLSLFTMICLKKIKGFSMIGVSIAGGVAHNVGQIIVAMCVLGRLIIFQLPYLILGGIGMGTVIGIVGAIVWKKLSRAINQCKDTEIRLRGIGNLQGIAKWFPINISQKNISVQENKKMATIRDISLKCGVSVSTVSKVLNGYREIGEETSKAVMKAAEELGYVPNSYARQLKLKKSYNIGVLFDTLSVYGLKNEYFAHILAALRENASRGGYDITFIENNIGNRRMTYLEHCKYRNFDGICIVCADFTNPEVLDVVNSDFPVVTIDHSFNEAISILSDNTGGMRELVEYIVSMGHKKIAYIHGNKSSVTHNRLVAFHQVLAEHEIQIPESYMKEGEYRLAESAEEFTYELLNLSDRPTCIIASDDYAALGVIKAIKRAGLRFPEDISVAGFDGISISQALEPKLTTVKQDTEKLGEHAAKKLICLMESPMSTPLENIVLRAELMIGDSVKKLR